MGLKLVFGLEIKSSCEPQRLLKRHCLTPPRNSLVKGERIVRHDGISDLLTNVSVSNLKGAPIFVDNVVRCQAAKWGESFCMVRLVTCKSTDRAAGDEIGGLRGWRERSEALSFDRQDPEVRGSTGVQLSM